MIQVSDEISRGHFHIEPTLSQVVYGEGGRDEIMQLADSINNMAKNLEVSQKQLRESEEKYRSLFDSGPNPIFVLDARSQEILDANPSAEESYGYGKEELKKMTFAELGGLQGGETALSLADKQCGGSDHIVVSKVQHFKKRNRQFYVNIHGCSARYKDREARGREIRLHTREGGVLTGSREGSAIRLRLPGLPPTTLQRLSR